MANRLLEPMPRNEQQIIRDAIRSGMFLNSAPATRAALLKHVDIIQANAQVRAVQERRRAIEAAQRTQMDYDRKPSDTLQSRIAPFRTFNHQMNDRRRIANIPKLKRHKYGQRVRADGFEEELLLRRGAASDRTTAPGSSSTKARWAKNLRGYILQ